MFKTSKYGALEVSTDEASAFFQVRGQAYEKLGSDRVKTLVRQLTEWLEGAGE